MANYGVQVTIVEFMDRMLPNEDEEVSRELMKVYEKMGVKLMMSTRVESIDESGTTLKVHGQQGRSATRIRSR
jgi:dihydrolipoamide dehydrogenase